MRIDAHQHFWRFDPARDAWITPEMGAIRRNFLPADLAPLLASSGIDGVVAVQADQFVAETEFLLGLSTQHAFIKGVVGWIDLRANDLARQVAKWSSHLMASTLSPPIRPCWTLPPAGSSGRASPTPFMAS